MRKILALLLCLVLTFTLLTPVTQAAETKEELLEVTLAVYSNRFGYRDVECLYQDNVLYIDQYTICDLTGALIHEEDSYSVTFSLHDGLRHIKVTTEGRLIEDMTYGRAYSVGADIPVVVYDGLIWVSAAPLLRYMGAVVGFGEDENSATHLMVSMPYTVYDLIVEFADNDGYWFSWAEAEGKFVDPEDMVYLAALDTVLLGYDSNLLAYISPNHGDKVQKDIYTDLLNEVLRTEGAELSDSGYNEVDLFEDASDTWSFSAAWIGEVLGWIEDSRFAGKLNSSMSGALNASGVLLSAGGDYLESLDAAMQFANMSSTQKNLLDNTLNLISPYNAYYQQLPLLFETAEEVSDLIGDKYAANEKAAWDGIYSLMVNAATTAMNSVNPFALAWDSLTTIAKLDPLMDDFLNDEKSITFAAEAQNVSLIARSLVAEDYNNLYAHNFYMLTDDTRYHEAVKLDIILELKATLLTRQLLADTGWLTESAQNMMEYRINWTAELLNKAQNAKPTTFGKLDNREEDITWIANLARSCALAWAQHEGGNSYYWKFSTDDFAEGGYLGYFSQVEDTGVEMVMRNADGRETTLFTTEVATNFVVIGGKLYYSAHSELIIYDLKTGELDFTGLWGTLCGVNRSGSYVICEYDGVLHSYCTANGAWTTLATDADYVQTHGNTVYYSPYATDYEAASMGQMTLSAVELDGTGDRVICTTAPDLYPSGSAVTYASVGQIRFSNDYIYFSYGSVGGTGMMFQGGKIIRVGYDGTAPTVVAGSSDLVGADFWINEDGSVTADTEDYYYVAYASQRTYEETNDGIVYYDPVSGAESLIVSASEYEDSSFDLSVVEDVAKRGNKVYIYVHYANRDSSQDFGWREYYTLEKTVLYMKDLENGEITQLYSTN